MLPPHASPLPVEAKTAAFPAEVRGAIRQGYPFAQRYAPIREGRWPTQEEFQPAELCDLSAQGVALWLVECPAEAALVLELGIGANVSQVAVRIVYVVPVETAAGPRYRVGCEFQSVGPS